MALPPLSSRPAASARSLRPAVPESPAPASRGAQVPPRRAEDARMRDTFEPDRARRPSGGTGPGAPVRTLVNALPPAERAAAAQRLSDPRQADAVRQLTTTPAWAQRGQRADLVRVLAASSPSGAADLVALARQPGRLGSRASDGQTLLHHLATTATQPRHGLLSQPGFGRERLMDGLLRDVAHPETITQGHAGTCGATSQLQPLARERPAEYARLVSGLTSTDGRVRMQGLPPRDPSDPLSTGFSIGPSRQPELELQADSLPLTRPGMPGSFDRRTLSSQLLQGAAMEYADGPLADYDPNADVSRTPGLPPRSGLTGTDMASLNSNLFGARVSSVDVDATTAPGELTEALARRDAQGQRVPVTAGLRTNAGNHAVEVLRVENGRVYVRDPNGAAGSRSEGLASAVPEARQESQDGEYSLPLEDFSRRAMSVQGPAREPRALGGPVGH